MPRINAEVSVNDLAYSLAEMEQSSLVETIRIADSIISEVEFTQWLIKTLVEVVYCDLTDEEKEQFLIDIKNILNRGE